MIKRMWINENMIDENTIGFVYIISENQNNTYYIGKKNIKCKRKNKIVESNWKNYLGSNKDFTNYLKTINDDLITKKILCVCDSQLKLTYNELKYQILYNWTSTKCWNSNVLGKFFKNKLL